MTTHGLSLGEYYNDNVAAAVEAKVMMYQHWIKLTAWPNHDGKQGLGVLRH